MVYDYLENQILILLKDKNASYAFPLNSKEIGESLNITPSYIRKKIKKMEDDGLIGVRKGSGGGYFLIERSRMIDEDNNR